MEIELSHNSSEENRLSQPRKASSEEHFVSAVFHLTNQSDAKTGKTSPEHAEHSIVYRPGLWHPRLILLSEHPWVEQQVDC